MSHHPPRSDDPKIQAYIDRVTKRAHRTEHIFRRILHILERFIAAITLTTIARKIYRVSRINPAEVIKKD